jgi:tetratricopeptide (TPR) repeat protein
VPDEPPPEDGGPKAYVYTADEAIEFFRQRVAKTPGDYISLRYLGEMYERKARETGDFAAFGKAEETLRRAVALNPEIARARASLAAVLCSRHKFAEGLEIARALVRQYPKDIDAQSTMGDALLELGRYDEAESTYRNLERLTPTPLPEVLARLANLAELRGDVDGALALMRRALDDVRKNRLPKDAAWFLARSGDMLFDAGAGKLDQAEAAYRAVPEGTDARHDATFGLGKVLAARGKDAEALEQFRKAVAIGPDLHMLAGLGDLYVRTGDLAKAEETFRRLEQEAVKQAEHARDLVYFYADHDRDLPRALELARKELASRADVFTRDALAWALLKNGRTEEAALAIVEALKVGTKDAKVHYHAGLIYAKLGDRDKARTHLTAALATNPHFSILGPDAARDALAALDRK